MSIHSNKVQNQSSLRFIHPKDTDIILRNGNTWLRDKRINDGAESFWRVHNNLYDLTDFTDKHPGGKMWLELTKGTDITEAFESHHFSTTPQEILEKHFVRVAKTPRNSPFTFEDNGFYRTLKRRITPLLKDVPNDSLRVSDITTDVLCIGTFVFALLGAATWSYVFGSISGILLGLTTIASHNYFHRKDNFRMYYFNISLMHFRDWRITHVLSHHLYPNTIIDFEIIFGEPFLDYLPRKKNLMVKYGSWLLTLVVWPYVFLLTFLKRILEVVCLRNMNQLELSHSIPFTLPALMYFFTSQTFAATLWMWLYIITCGSFLFSVIGFTAAHHHPEIFHDGDRPRSTDWGMHQLAAVADRYEVTGSPFRVLTSFGDHALHHMFPTLDHGALKYLYGTLQEVMDEFGTNLRMKSQVELIKGMYRQLARELPN